MRTSKVFAWSNDVKLDKYNMYIGRLLLMEEANTFIPVSYNTRNSSSMMMFIVVLIGFIVFCVIIMNLTRKKLFPTPPADHLDYTNIINNSLESALNVAVGNMVDASYNKLYEKNLTAVNTYKQDHASEIMNILSRENAIQEINTNKFDFLNNTLTSMNTIVGRLQKLQNSNIQTLENYYKTYQTKFQNFVNSLVLSLKNINAQITILNTDDKYKPLINPLSKIFTSIRNSLVANTSTIQKIYKTFDSSILPELTKPTSTMPSVTNTAPDILRNSGY